MSFTETRGVLGRFATLAVRNGSGSQIIIIPEMGARLNSFTVASDADSIDIIDGYTSPEELSDEYYAKSSFLAPFPNRVADGRYDFLGKTYQLPINKEDEHNAIHGFISDKAFRIVSASSEGDRYVAVFEYQSPGEEGFPFPFRSVVTYTLFEGNQLSVKTEIQNTGNTSMPAGFGWHPYFTLGGAVDELELRMPPVEQIEVDGRLIPTGKVVPNDAWAKQKKIADTRFDTGFRLTGAPRSISLVSSRKNLEVTVSVGEGYGYVQLFTPPWRTSIAVEPMTCGADAFNNGFGLKTLHPREALSAEFEIEVNALM